MAKIVLIGLERAAGGQLRRALEADGHEIIQHQKQDIPIRELLDADIVFAGGEPTYYMSLLRRVREAQPTIPFIVVTQIPETKQWLDALEAGATDYCSVPIETLQLRWLMESVLPRLRSASA